MDRFGWNLHGWSHPIMSLPGMSAMMQLPWQRPLPSNGSLDIQQLWASGGQTHETIIMKFGIQQQIGPLWQLHDQMLKFLKFKMAEQNDQNVGKYWKCHNSPTVAVAPDCTLPASASSESSRSLGGDGRQAWSPYLRFLIGDHGVWGPCRGILYFMPLSESKSTRTVVSNAVGVCAMSMMRQLV